MNAIAFSLYGNGPKYCHGMIRNAELAPIVYPGWRVVVYYDATVPHAIVQRLSRMGCATVSVNNRSGLFWRFGINDNDQAERYIVRDADSRLNFRERRAVDAWIASGKKFHLIRDHPYHRQIVMGGLWGAVRGVIPNMAELIQKHAEKGNTYGCDQRFLASAIWPMVKDDSLQHDSCLRSSYPGSVPLPDGLKMGDWRFCGEIFDENDEPQRDQWEKRINFMEP